MKTYKVSINCNNCGFSGLIEVLWGKSVLEESCPNCGVQSITTQETNFREYDINRDTKPKQMIGHPGPDGTWIEHP